MKITEMAEKLVLRQGSLAIRKEARVICARVVEQEDVLLDDMLRPFCRVVTA